MRAIRESVCYSCPEPCVQSPPSVDVPSSLPSNHSSDFLPLYRTHSPSGCGLGCPHPDGDYPRGRWHWQAAPPANCHSRRSLAGRTDPQLGSGNNSAGCDPDGGSPCSGVLSAVVDRRSRSWITEPTASPLTHLCGASGVRRFLDARVWEGEQGHGHLDGRPLLGRAEQRCCSTRWSRAAALPDGVDFRNVARIQRCHTRDKSVADSPMQKLRVSTVRCVHATPLPAQGCLPILAAGRKADAVTRHRFTDRVRRLEVLAGAHAAEKGSRRFVGDPR